MAKPCENGVGGVVRQGLSITSCMNCAFNLAVYALAACFLELFFELQ